MKFDMKDLKKIEEERSALHGLGYSIKSVRKTKDGIVIELNPVVLKDEEQS